MPIVKRLSIIAGLILLLLLSAPVIVLFTLGHSEAALRYVVAQLPTKAGSLEKLQIDNVRGTLAGGFSVERIVIEHDLVYLAQFQIVMWVAQTQPCHRCQISSYLHRGKTYFQAYR